MVIKARGLDVLSINTYGGSLLVGAKLAGLKVRGSYEDSGYGAPIPKLNFPELNFIDDRKHWPQQDLSSTVVIAHPPCAAFSNMNNSPDKKGVNTDAFACTVSVMEYAMRNQAAGLAIESVMGAYEGGRIMHEKYARKYGYEVYRLLENSITYGVPQWRKRFWVMFVPKGSVKRFVVSHRPRFQTVGEMMQLGKPGAPIDKLEKQWDLNQEKLLKHLDRRAADRMLAGGVGYGLLPVIAAGHCMRTPTKDRKKLATKYHWDGGSFQCFWLKILDPNGYAPTLLGSSWWGCQGRSLYENEYKACMGFPRDYKYPDGKYRKEMRLYLSKGVCPPVAAHVLDTLVSNLNNTLPSGLYSTSMHRPQRVSNANSRFFRVLTPGTLEESTADFRIKEKEFQCLGA